MGYSLSAQASAATFPATVPHCTHIPPAPERPPSNHPTSHDPAYPIASDDLFRSSQLPECTTMPVPLHHQTERGRFRLLNADLAPPARYSFLSPEDRARDPSSPALRSCASIQSSALFPYRYHAPARRRFCSTHPCALPHMLSIRSALALLR